jgi:hypothetical protein
MYAYDFDEQAWLDFGLSDRGYGAVQALWPTELWTSTPELGAKGLLVRRGPS